MTLSLKSIAIAAVLSATSVFGAVTPASSMTISIPDLSFPNAETRQGCYFTGTCEDPETSAKQQHVTRLGDAKPANSPRNSTKTNR